MMQRLPSMLLDDVIARKADPAPGRSPLVGRGKAASRDDLWACEVRMEQLSETLLALYAPCAPEEFPQRALEVTRRLLPARLITFEQFDLNTGEITSHALGELPLEPDEFLRRWRTVARDHPILRAHLRHGLARAVTYSLEDFLPEAGRGDSELDRKIFRPLGIRQQLAVLFPVSDIATGLFVSRDEPFNDSERKILSLLAPHLAQAHHNHLLLAPAEARPAPFRNVAWQRLRSAGFSRRECEVLQWLAEGKSDEEIALILNLARKTVSKQVLDLMHKLEAKNRIGAVSSALQLLEMPHPVELELTARDREEQFQTHLLRLSSAQTPAALLQHLRQVLAEMWPGFRAEAWLVRLDASGNRFAALSPSRVAACAERMHLRTDDQGPQLPGLVGAPHGTIGAIRCFPLPPSAYLWENRAAPAGELLSALIFLPERLAFAIVLEVDAHSFGSQRLEEWRRLAPHLLVAGRGAFRYARAASAPLTPAPPPASDLWRLMACRHLTERQSETLAWVAAGLSDQEIAAQLGISTRTIHAHLRAIFETLGVENRVAAVLEACREIWRHLAYEGE
jgi:DNA-binding NarL/FixJ family response regulator